MNKALKDIFISYINKYGGDYEIYSAKNGKYLVFGGQDGPDIKADGLSFGKDFIPFTDSDAIDEELNYGKGSEEYADYVYPSKSWKDFLTTMK